MLLKSNYTIVKITKIHKNVFLIVNIANITLPLSAPEKLLGCLPIFRGIYELVGPSIATEVAIERSALLDLPEQA